MANMLRNANDERNVLYKYFHKIVDAKKPKYFLAENVRGILSLEKGAVIKQIVSDFTLAGYNVQYKVFNMADYGVPQSRIRVIICGNRIDLNPDEYFVFPNPILTKPQRISIGQSLKNIPEPDSKSHNLKNHIFSKYKITNRNFTGHRKTDPEKPSPTILARGNGKGGVCAIQHPKNHRRLSVRESAIIQTFPINFEFLGKMNSMYRQIGNAVPVLFGQILGEQLKRIESKK
jgi:DNA (cytosine-5)-methyltransferase 1